MTKRARYETMCRTCQTIVGVWQTPWNRGGGNWTPIPKTSRHKDPAGRECPGGYLSVEPSTVFEKAAA